MRSLVQVGIDCVTNKSKLEWKLHFFEWKTHSFVLNFIPRTLEIAFYGFEISKEIFWQRTPPDPLRRRGLTAPCWYSWILSSNLLASSIFIETPAFSNTSSYASLSWFVQGESWAASGGQCGAKYSPTPAYQNVCSWNREILVQKHLFQTS